jgi:selenocysteine-specific elongation factor
MIIATAGHVDHGKTLLVKALTGIDADRLPEEKKRGMTIDLGFAYLPMEGAETVGFVDVPGHERFIHNMLAGVAGIDFVLFILAADDGVMPQTREHLAILDLLNVRSGAVAITKIDRVPPSRVAEVRDECAALLAGTTLDGARILPVSAVSGEGIAVMMEYLLREARTCPPRPASGNFRLAIDRCFSLSGAGLIVTGTVFSGAVAAGEQVRVLQAGLSARIRSIHAQNSPAQSGRAGQRCALNLSGAGLKQEAICRGDWVVTGNPPEPASKLDTRIRAPWGQERPLAHWTPVHVHLGTADVTGRVAILDGSSIAPGDSALVQLVLDRPLGAVRGDGLILRDQSAQCTIGGGYVIDVFPPRRGRARPGRLADLHAMDCDNHQQALTSLLEGAAGGVSLQKFTANRNLTHAEAQQIFGRVQMRVVQQFAYSIPYWSRLRQTTLENLEALHRREPAAIAFPEKRLLSAPREVALAVTAELLREHAIVREASGVRLASHLPKLEGLDTAQWKRIAPLLAQNPLRPPTMNEIAAAIREDPKKIESFLLRASRLGLLIRVTANRFFLPEAILRLAAITEDFASRDRDRRVTAATLRDATNMGRTVAIEVLEYFDRVRLTRRVGDSHEVVARASDILKFAVTDGRETHPGGAPGLQIR